MTVELNPHIIKKLNRWNRTSLDKELFNSSFMYVNSHELLLKHMEEMQEAFGIAKKIAKDVPIAYRLEPVTKPLRRDNINVQKFGGIPNLNLLYSLLHYSKIILLKNEKHRIVTRPHTAYSFIEDLWPRCKCCNARMQFIGQFELHRWMLAIHILTGYSVKGDGGSKKIGHKYSAMGWGHRLTNVYPSHRYVYLFWFCSNGHFDESPSDVQIDLAHVPSGNEVFNPDEDAYRFRSKLGVEADKIVTKSHVEDFKNDYCRTPWTDEEYIAAVKKFMKDNKIRIDKRFESPIPREKVIGYNIRFDIDWKKRFASGKDWKKVDNTIDRIEKNSLFKKNHQFQFFGAPSSQQRERRYMCPSSWMIHRQNPLLSWWDSNHDMSHQLYGCLRCPSNESGDVIYGKMDSSCT